MSSILFIKPYWPYPYGKGEHTYNRIWPPLSLANCAAILEQKGFRVKILDAHALRIKPEKMKFHVKGFDKIFVTSSSLDRWTCPNINIEIFLETVQNIRELTDEVYVMGYHGTVEPGNILNITQAKAVIRGEPEYTVSDICQGMNLRDIEGVSYRENNRVVSNPDRSQFDLQVLPVPAYHHLNNRRYFYEILGDHFALFEMSRGCPHNCKFCTKIMYGRGWRSKSKDQIMRELTVAVEKYGIKTGYFMDLEFLLDSKLVNNVCDFLISKKYYFKWCCQTRPDSLDEVILAKMKKAGCELIHLGVESGSQDVLNLSGKNVSVGQIINGVEMCRKAGIKTLAFYMFGFRGEKVIDREKTFQFAKKLNTDFVSFHKVYPYYDKDIYSSEIAGNKDIDRFIRRKYLKYYLRFSYLRKLNLMSFIKCFKLFVGRFVTL